jgi:hypothetical protein
MISGGIIIIIIIIIIKEILGKTRRKARPCSPDPAGHLPHTPAPAGNTAVKVCK